MEYDSFTAYPEYLQNRNRKYRVRKAIAVVFAIVAWVAICYFASWGVTKV